MITLEQIVALLRASLYSTTSDTDGFLFHIPRGVPLNRFFNWNNEPHSPHHPARPPHRSTITLSGHTCRPGAGGGEPKGGAVLPDDVHHRHQAGARAPAPPPPSGLL